MTSTSYIVPNSIVAIRVVFAFAAVVLMRLDMPWAGMSAIVLIVVSIAMDGLDGYVARRMGLASRFGSVLDITADRIVENVFWIAFAVAGVVSLWVPLIVMTRSFLVDAARGVALASGKTAFGDSTMMRSSLTRFLTGSRLMRNAYGVAKTSAFVLLGVVVAWGGGAALLLAAHGCVAAAVALCLVRGVPVLSDARPYLMSTG